MRKIISMFLAILLVMSSCSNQEDGAQQGADSAAAWQEQYDLGIRYLTEGNYEEAIIAFTAAIEIDPKRAEAYVVRGDAYVGVVTTLDEATDAELISQNYNNAEENYLTAIELDEINVDAYLNLADVYIALGENETALEILQTGYERTGSQEIADKITEVEEKQFFTDPVRLEEWTINGIPFWEASVTDFLAAFSTISEMISELDDYVYLGRSISESDNLISIFVSARLMPNKMIKYISYGSNAAVATECRDIIPGMRYNEVLQVLGISQIALNRLEEGEALVYYVTDNEKATIELSYADGAAARFLHIEYYAGIFGGAIPDIMIEFDFQSVDSDELDILSHVTFIRYNNGDGTGGSR